MKKRNMIYLLLIIFVLLLVLGIIGKAYSWYKANIIGSAKETSGESGFMSLNFEKSGDITLNNLIPGKSQTITFSVENKGTNSTYYNLIWESLINELTRKEDLKIEISSTNNGGSLASTILSETGEEISIIEGINIEEGQTQEYILKITYEKLETIDQSVDMEKSVKGKINIIPSYMSDNLFINGNLELKNNTNFSSFTYDESESALKATNFVKSFFSDNYIPIDSTATYIQSVEMKSIDPNLRYYMGFAEFDIDKNMIMPWHVMYTSDVTTLTQDLKNGDTIVHLDDVSSWKVDETTPTYQRGLIFWNYKDSTGHLYPPKTYSRNVGTDLYLSENVDKTNNTITLKKPWDKGTFLKGTSVSNTNSGENYNYGIKGNGTIPLTWTKYKNIIAGETTNNNDISKSTKFRKGTKYIKMILFKNGSDPSNSTIYLKNISFRRIK